MADLITKLDAEVWFDKLQCLTALSQYMGRRAIYINELQRLGMNEIEITAHALMLDGATQLTPVNRTWAMGSSGSFFVAQ